MNESDAKAQPSSPARGEMKKHPRRGWVWALIVVAAVLITLSITANWLQSEVLDDQQWNDTTTEVVQNQEVQDALSQYLVTQLYASVDVTQQLNEVLPPPANKLSPQLSGVVEQLAQNAANRLLEAPRVQARIVKASNRAHDQLIKLLDDKDTYIKTNNGEVVLDLSGVINDLAVQLGLSQSTVDQIQGFVQGELKDLNSQLSKLDSTVTSLDTSLDGYSGGALSSTAQQQVGQAQAQTSSLQSSLTKIQGKIDSVLPKLPPRVQQAAKQLNAVFAQLDGKLQPLNEQLTAVKQQPTAQNVAELQTTLGQIDSRIKSVQSRPILQSPGQLVLVKSSNLEGAQTATKMFRHLGFVLPLLVMILFLLALYLAAGWRREALIYIGVSAVVASLVLLVAVHWIGSSVVNTLAANDTNQSAVNSVWNILSDGLYAKIWFTIATGVLFVLAGMLAGPGRAGTKVREWLAPALRDHIPLVYIGVGVLFLIRLAVMPTPQAGNIIPQIVLAVLAVLGVEALRRQTAEEFPKTGSSGLA
jgi:hypothetical protein